MKADVQLPQAQQFIHWFAKHLEDEEVRVEWIAPQGSMRFEIEQVGSVRMLLESSSHIDCELHAANTRMEHLMRLSLAEHLQQFAEMQGLAEADWSLRWRDLSSNEPAVEKPRLHRMRVLSNIALTPRMRRITLQADDVTPFLGGGLHVRMLLPQEGRVDVVPTMDDDGRLHWPEGAEPLARRTYTIRAFNQATATIDIDALLHGDGLHAAPGSDWAQSARVNSEVLVLSPAGGRMPTAKRLVLVADACAVPAVARILESLDSTQSASVLCWVAANEERAMLPAHLAAQVDWIYSGTPGASPEGITAVLDWLAARDWSAPQDLELWAAGGHAMADAVRRWARSASPMKDVRKLVGSYWR